LNAAEIAACQTLIKLALAEDLGSAGDLTSQAVIPPDCAGRAVFVGRTWGTIAGLPAAAAVVGTVDPRLHLQTLVEDGTRVEAGARLAVVSGPMRSILAAERTALNFLQRLSGVATQTRRYVDAIAGLPTQILDTRKTTPGWRLLEKYAVRRGGGHNHRMGLYDGILIKDNHLAALSAEQKIEAVKRAVQLARSAIHAPRSTLVEIEVDNLEQLDAALATGPDIILLDNMPLDMLREAVRRRNEKARSVKLEASGGVTLATVRAIAETGVDRISVGALTHSAPALDIALDYSE
jgi:nicotinate-nucleotide pyrophosphorylase (carboxylating)